jgi:DNA-binding transcriptional LysR family regulator
MLADLVAGEAGHMRLGAIEPAASLRLPPILLPYFEAHPRVQLSLEVANSTTLRERVAAGQLDAAIAAAPPAELSLVFIPLFVEPLTLLVPENHPLASQALVTLADVARHRILLSERTCAYRQLVERAMLQHGASLYATIELGSLGLVKRGVQDGLGIAILPESIVVPPPEGTRVRTLEDEPISLTVGFVLSDREDALAYQAVHDVLAQLATHLVREGYVVPKRLRDIPAPD